jgi:putative ABC transport system ATP-binding protein
LFKLRRRAQDGRVLEVLDLTKTYGPPDQATSVLRGVSFKVEAGSFCAVVGPSGSGKSTLMNIIGLLDRPTSGILRLDGLDVAFGNAAREARFRGATIGFVFQSFNLLPRLNAWENVALPLVYAGASAREREQSALAMLERVGLSHRAQARPAELSGGQRQRVALARALIRQPRLVLADEPTGSLDSVTAGEVMTLLRDLNRRLGVTVLMVTHDKDLAMRCERRIEVLDGRVVADTAATE